MRLSRRTLLAGASVAAAAAALPGCGRAAGTVVDVRNFGARGDGVTDDSSAIQAAAQALESGATLRFPSGTYRFAQRWPDGAAAIVIAGVSDVAVEFDPGAELLMDNLDPQNHTGTSHGVLVHGPASRILLRRVNIRWAGGARRSLGDGIRVQGFPGPPAGWLGQRAPVTGVTLSDCVVRASPQAGVIMMGVSDITVTGLRVADTAADGLHFNACRNATIDGVEAVGTGDDGVALVTYFAPQFSFDDASHTFSYPALNAWSNTDFAINNVRVVDSAANGVRLAGAYRVTLGGLQVVGARSGAAVMVDSAEPGTDVGWNYVASRAVRIDDFTAANCDTGLHLLARPGDSGDQQFTDFGVHVDDAKIDDCSNWSVRAESLAEQRVRGLHIQNCRISATATTGGKGGVGIRNAHRISLGHIIIEHAEPVVTFRATHAGEFTVDRLRVTIDHSEQPIAPASPFVSLRSSDGRINGQQTAN